MTEMTEEQRLVYRARNTVHNAIMDLGCERGAEMITRERIACPVCDKILATVRVSGGSALHCPRCQRIIPPGELERARAIKRLTEGAMDVIDQAVSEGKLPG